MLSQLCRWRDRAYLRSRPLLRFPPPRPLHRSGRSFIPAVADSGALNPTLVQGKAATTAPATSGVATTGAAATGPEATGTRAGLPQLRWLRSALRWLRHRHYGGYGRRWHGNGWGGSGFALGLGLGIPLGYYGGGYYNNYYNPYYGDPYYAAPVYRPRVYRGGGSTHVEWCYNRYRSYRAWDNTFQPYNGPRQQCYSPYS